MGLAHGDPYPFNGICTGSGATWVDFGHLTNDSAQPFKDAWAFVLFTVLHTLGKCRAYSPVLLKNLAAALVAAEQPGRFNRIRETLSESYSDVVPTSDARVPSLIFAEAVAEHSQKIFQNPDLCKLLLKSTVQYFSDFLHHIQRGNQYFTGFHFEKQRYHFIEQEMLRLTVPLAEHRSQIASLSQAVSERDGQITSLNQAVIERDGTLSYLSRVVDEQGAQVLHLSETAKYHYEQFTRLLASHSWKMTRPIRAVARFITHDGLTNNDRGRLYNGLGPCHSCRCECGARYHCRSCCLERSEKYYAADIGIGGKAQFATSAPGSRQPGSLFRRTTPRRSPPRSNLN